MRGTCFRAAFFAGLRRFVHPLRIISNLKSKIKMLCHYNQKKKEENGQGKKGRG